MKALKFLPIFLLGFFLFGCAPNSGTTKLKVSLGAVVSTDFPGGLIVMGKNQTGSGSSFAIPIGASDVFTIELENGRWNFVLMGWDGANNFEGANFCGFQNNVTLDGADVGLEIEVTKLNCNAVDLETATFPVFGEVAVDATDGTGQFPKMVFNSCGEVKGYIEEGNDIPSEIYCGPGNGDMIPGGLKGFKVSIGQKLPDGKEFFGLESRCIGESSIIDHNSNTIYKGFSDLRLPRGSKTLPFRYKIETFAEADCSGPVKDILIWKEGIIGADPTNHAYAAYNLGDNTNQIIIHSDLCNSAQVAMSPFGNSPSNGVPPSAGEARLICNTNHWHAINADLAANPGQSYTLGSDIDFLGSNTTFTNIFQGSLRGNKHVIKNGDSPLIGTIAPGSEEIRINDLVISNMNINLTAGSNSFGILAMTIIGNGNVDGDGNDIRIELDRIDLTSDNNIVGTNTSSGRNIGGLIGSIDFVSNAPVTNELFIRLINSRANVDAGADLSNISTTGGLIGRAEGDANQNYYLVLEENLVGVENEDDPYNPSGRISVKGKRNVGGLIGQADRVEVRGYTVAHVSLEGGQFTGGVIGLVYNDVSIEGVHVDSVLRPLPGQNPVSDFGGVVGGKNGVAQHMSIRDVVAKSAAPNNTMIPVNDLGGIIGSLNNDSSSGSSEVYVTNVKADVNFSVDGNNVGGLIGSYSDSALTPGQSGPVVSNSLVKGTIGIETSGGSVDSRRRGGFIGQNNQGSVELSRVDMNSISGWEYLGGAFGENIGGRLTESEIILSSIGSFGQTHASVNVGGFFGSYADSSAAPANILDRSKVKTTILLDPTPAFNCAAGSTCGQLIGNQQSTFADLANENIVKVSFLNNGGADTLCGVNDSNCVDGAEINNIQADEQAINCSSLAGFPFLMDPVLSICRPLFASKWDEFGRISGTILLAGNAMEPFPLQTPADWNSIGTDMFLLTKTYELKNDIDFAHGAFTPLGGDDNAMFDEVFRGKIYSNGKSLRNITYTTTDIKGDANQSSGGLVPILEGELGDREEPLYIENLNLTCDVSKCGVVGESKGGRIHVIVKNAAIDGSATADVGGLVGFESTSHGEIAYSGFEGKIDVPAAYAVGGIMGRYDPSNGGVRINESYAKLAYIIGANHVGGMLGSAVASGNSSSIEDSYVNIFDGRSGADFDAVVSTNAGGFVGNPLQNVDIRDSYISYLGANLPADFKSISGTDANFNADKVYVIGDTLFGSDGSGNVILKGSHKDAYDDYFSRERDWAIDANGVIRFDWEVNGFEHN